jgi:hypothetical protein
MQAPWGCHGAAGAVGSDFIHSFAKEQANILHKEANFPVAICEALVHIAPA